MALIQVDGTTITSATASFSLGGIDDNSVYLALISGAEVQTQNDDINIRVGSTSSNDSTSNYDYGAFSAYSGSEIDNGGTNGTSWTINFVNLHASGYGAGNGWIYLYNWYDSGARSIIQYKHSNLYTGGAHVYGSIGGGVHTVDQSNTNIYFGFGGNIIKGEFGLYKVV